MRHSASAAGALAALVLLVGCASATPAGDGDPTPTPTVTSTEPTPSPDPTPTADPGVAGLTIRTEKILLVDASGEVLGEHDYYAPAAPLIAALTEAFGAPPEVEELPGGAGHAVPTTVSRWNGFEVFDAVTEASKPAVSDYFVRATAASVNGVAIEAVEGTEVGDTLQQVKDEHPDAWRQDIDDGTYTSILLDRVEADLGDGSPPGTYGNYVWIIVPDETGAVSDIRAPSADYGA